MANNRRKASKPSSGGSTWFGLLAGLIIGLAAAAAVAFLVTQVPMPFVDKASRDPARTLLPDVRDAPDPNIGLYGRGEPAGTAPGIPAIPPAAGGSATDPNASMSDDIGALLATLGGPAPGQPAAKPAAPPASATRSEAPAPAAAPATATPAPTPATPATKPGNTQTTYYLQAGAFRSQSDAEAMQARILLLGLPVQVQKAQVNGTTLHRVRVGPFKGIDDMNRSRVQLGEAKIESTVVRP